MASGYTAIADGQGTNDCNGHGTHVAGTVGGATYGVAKSVTLKPVRVLDCGGSGTNSGVIAGVDWVTGNKTGPAVANMSLGGGVSSALDSAVQSSINAGVTYAVAAGNDNGANACNGSPSASVRADRRLLDQLRRTVELLQHRLVPRPVRAGLEHHLGLVHQQHRDQHDQWYVDGDAPRRGCRGALPAGRPERLSRHGVQRDRQRRHQQRAHQRGHRIAEQAALLAPRRRQPAAAPSGNLLGNPGFESGNTVWAASSG